MKRIVGEHLIGEAPATEDAQHNTDLIVLRLEAVRVACRVRQYRYFADYPDEFTIRSKRPSDVKTELAKVLEGWGDYLLYAFADQSEQHLAAWMLGDLRVFRLWFQRECYRLPAHSMPGLERRNGDGSSTFRAFSLPDLPTDFVVARHRPTTPIESEVDDLAVWWAPAP
jgi:hypothetical protein